MQYFLLAFLFVILVLTLFKIFLPSAEVDFELKGALSFDKLKNQISALALKSKKYSPRGKGLSVRLISKYLEQAYRLIGEKSAAGEEIFEFETWIHDNYYKLREMVHRQRRAAVLYFQLPSCGELPRLYSLMSLLVKTTDGFVTEGLLTGAAEIFNVDAPLTFAEVSAVRNMLSFCLLEYVAIFCSKSIKINRLFKRAKRDAARNKFDLAYLHSNSYVYRYKRLAGDNLAQLYKLCEDNGQTAEARENSFLISVARYCGQVSGAIKTCHQLDSWLTDKVVLGLSPVHGLLSVLAAEHGYPSVSGATKFLYLQSIAHTARRKKLGELAVARKAAANASTEKTDVAEFILPRPLGKAAMLLFVFCELLLAAGLGFAVYFFLPAPAWGFLLAGFPILLHLSAQIVAVLVKMVKKRRYLPLIDLKEEEGDKHLTAVVTSRLVADEGEIEDAFARLATNYYANPQELFTHCLLLDFPSAKSAEPTEKDGELLQKIREQYSKLNRREKFCVLVRRRKQNKNGVFSGWEKKRGALLDFNEYARGRGKENFLLALGEVKDISYVIALDSDSMVNCCYELVQMMAHPYNKKYNVINLAMNSVLEKATPFSRLFGGYRGISSYNGMSAEAEFDLFGCGNFTGKGIYRVDAFSDKVRDLPENRILSHDYLEGAFSGCAGSPFKGMDGFPGSFSTYLMREMRWLRGDWQLLPFLFMRYKNIHGKRVKNPISVVNRWHIFTNMIFSLVPVSMAVLLAWSLFTPMLVPVLFALAPAAFAFLAAVRQSALGKNTAAFSELARQIVLVCFLPTRAILSLYSIALTLVRLMRGRNLLEWKVFAHTKSSLTFAFNYLVAVGLTAYVIAAGLNPFFYVLAGLFFLAWPIDRLLCRPLKSRRYASAHFDASLRELAKKTFQYFEDSFTEENNYLPCDNFQQYGAVGWTRRTSPTNIGFMLVAYACAFELELINEQTLNDRIAKMTETIDKMEKWQGNLYNWTDVTNLKTLAPRYVSAVDSGNFLACCLLASTYVNAENRAALYRIVNATRLDMLYDDKRELLHLGYNEDSHSMDAAHYDLLGSESSLTYLVGCGLGKLEKRAFDNLNKECVRYKGKSLLSWTGGMFEYFMTDLFYTFPHRGLLAASAGAVVKGQIAYAKSRGFKAWGISESQYNAFDAGGGFLYRAFGVPPLAYSQSGRGDVVAGYAGFFALDYNPKAVERNLARLIESGMYGHYGIYESYNAISGEVMSTYMAHHQGMAMAAMTNYLTLGALKKRYASLASVRAGNLLLALPNEGRGKRARREAKKITVSPKPVTDCKRHAFPHVNFLTNGKYTVLSDESGYGFSRFDSMLLTRPARRGGIRTSAVIGEKSFLLSRGTYTFGEGFTRYDSVCGELSLSMEIRVLPTINGEVRKVCVTNRGAAAAKLGLVTLCEVALCRENDYFAHPAYANLFVESGQTESFAYAERKTGEGSVCACHFNLGAPGTEYILSRRKFYQRGQTADAPQNLDTVLASKCELILGAGESAQVEQYFLCAYDLLHLKQLYNLISVDGFSQRVFGYVSPFARSLLPQTETLRLASRILYGAGSLSVRETAAHFNPTMPVVCITARLDAIELFAAQLAEYRKLLSLGLRFNVAVVYSEKQSYLLQLSQLVQAKIAESGLSSVLGEGKLAVINAEQSPALSKLAQENSVKVGDNPEVVTAAQTAAPPVASAVVRLTPKLSLGLGGFDEDYSYVMNLGELPPKPWSNIVAGAEFGAVMTESGGGYTFGQNARELKLSRWSNDDVLDPVSEGIVLGEKGLLWSVTRSPLKKDACYTVRHALGYTEYGCGFNGIKAELTQFCARAKAAKFYILTLENTQDSVRTLSAMYFIDAVLGDFKQNTRHALSARRTEKGVELQNAVNGMKAHLFCSQKILSFSPFAESYSDEEGNIVKNENLSGAGSDFMPAYSVSAVLPPNGKTRVIFALSLEDDLNLAEADGLLADAAGYYGSLSQIELDSFDELGCIFKWLPYQTLCSRFFGRTGFYQAGGAYGFRDQLQDCFAVMHIDPALVRAHILNSAAHQFEDGDVQHWWHTPAVGVRTRFCDDRLFLPLTVAEYIFVTADYDVMAERVPYLEDIPMGEGVMSVYAAATPTMRWGSILEHCMRAIKVSLDLGENGLVKMGGGDWNDAMDEVGRGGKGTSVFCSMFLFYVIKRFLPYVNNLDDRKELVAAMDGLKTAVDRCWDGEWFTRAYTDDGAVLGSAASKECTIDLLCQSWAVLSEIADEEKCEIALASAYARLVDERAQIVKLLSPPIKDTPNIGYIARYPKGVRENGGQYTHAAIWFAMSLFKKHDAQRAFAVSKMLNPIRHSQTAEDVKRYGGEPYVVAADIYDGDFTGRAGWTWYTGSAAWYYRLITDYILGLKKHGNSVAFSPCLPSEIKELTVYIKAGSGRLAVTIDNTKKEGEWKIVNGRVCYNSNSLRLSESLAGKTVRLERRG